VSTGVHDFEASDQNKKKEMVVPQLNESAAQNVVA
jgi:hypothetical protein